MIINVRVQNKVAQVVDVPVIICGNSGYTVNFTFDSEWDAYDVKTARFTWVRYGEKQYTDVSFTGNSVDVPVLSDIVAVFVGVFAGNLSTTTPAKVACQRSILCAEGVKMLKGDPGDPGRSLVDVTFDGMTFRMFFNDGTVVPLPVDTSEAAEAEPAGDQLVMGVKGAKESEYRVGQVDLTPENVGAVPVERKVNNKALSGDITLTHEDVGAVPDTRKVNGQTLNKDLTLEDIGAVPVERTVNGKALSGDITLTPEDVGAAEEFTTGAGELGQLVLPGYGLYAIWIGNSVVLLKWGKNYSEACSTQGVRSYLDEASTFSTLFVICNSEGQLTGYESHSGTLTELDATERAGYMRLLNTAHRG